MLIGIILCAAPFILFLGIHNFVIRIENFLRDEESTESANFHKKTTYFAALLAMYVFEEIY